MNARVLTFTLPDPELEKIAGHCGSSERLQMAEKCEAWAKMLRMSAFQLDAAGVTEVMADERPGGDFPELN